MTGNADFEATIGPYLDAAATLGDLGVHLIERLLPSESTLGTMPDGTIFRLHTVSTINYRSAVLCLRQAETSLSAFGLLRGILEAWAHLRFIAEGATANDIACRALRYERGAIAEWSNNARSAPPGFDHETWRAAHEQREQDLQVLWGEFGCAGKQRSQGDTTATIKAITMEPRMEWVEGVWKATSGTVHMYGVEFALHSTGDDVTDLVWAQPSHRATWLMFLTAAYTYMTITAATILHAGGMPEVIALNHAVRGIAEAPVLRRAAAGHFD